MCTVVKPYINDMSPKLLQKQKKSLRSNEIFFAISQTQSCAKCEGVAEAFRTTLSVTQRVVVQNARRSLAF